MNIDKNYMKNILPRRPEDSHKGTFGSVLNIAGSRYYCGAAYFSSVSSLKAGCGKSTLASDENTLKAIASLGPDIILMPVDKINKETIKNYQAISIGCGLSSEKEAIELFRKIIKLLKNSDIPLVIDADGLNILSTIHPLSQGARVRCLNLPPNTILTPHPKELAKLMCVNIENILLQPEFWAKKCSEKYNCTTVLKLHKTIVCDNKGHIYINNTGNSALSHAGSGDILCGMITGFLASGSRSEPELACNMQDEKGELSDGDIRVCDNKLHRSIKGLTCFEASILAVYLHGKTGEIASKELTEYSTLSSDLLKYIPYAIKSIL